jgi:hypothetical protein
VDLSTDHSVALKEALSYLKCNTWFKQHLKYSYLFFFLSCPTKIEVLSSLIADEEFVETYQLRYVKAVNLTDIFGYNCA